MKRANESHGPPPKRGRGPGLAGKCVFKVLCPDELVARILGSKGSNGQAVAQIQDSSGCHCNFSRRHEFYPNSNLRTLVVSGATPGDIMTCLDLILDQVVLCSEEERQALESQGKIGLEDGDFIDTAGDIRLCLAVTEPAAKGGRDGPESVTRMQEETEVRLYVQETVENRHQLVVMAGSRDQLLLGLEFWNAAVQAGVEEDWFAPWAEISAFGNTGHGGGYSKEVQAPIRARGSVNPSAAALKNVIFVGGLSQNTDNAGLTKYFSGFGDVVETDVKRDPQTGRSKGFGFVTFASEEPAEACLAEPKGHSIDGKTVELKRYGYSYPPGRTAEAPASWRPLPTQRDSRAPPGEYHDSHGGGIYAKNYARPSGPGLSQPGLSSLSRPVGGSVARDYDRGYEHRGYEREMQTVPHSKVAEDVRWFGTLADTVPAQYLDQDYCITCSLPHAQCGALIGRGGENINEVERKTGTNVQLSKKEQDSDHRTLTIIGPLISVYAAHLLMMRHFNDALNAGPPALSGPPDGGKGSRAPYSAGYRR